jgi:hypothetical protein
MRSLKSFRASLALLAIGGLSGCSDTATKAPNVTESIRKSLDQAGLKDVSVNQDRDKSVVTLTGQVATDSDKSQAESIARSIAGAQVVADQIAVRPSGWSTPSNLISSLFPVFWLKMRYSPGERIANSWTRVLASSRVAAASSQRRLPPVSAMKISNGENINLNLLLAVLAP